MRYVLEDVQAGMVASEIRRKGIPADKRVRVTVETLDDGLPLAQMAEEGGAFRFLSDEPDLYSQADILP